MEVINITGSGKKQQYEELLPQIFSLLNDESNPIANMANTAAALKQAFAAYSWVGFYLRDKNAQELVLGPFQGKIACTRITIGKGVCGTSFKNKETIVVPDVNQFPGHIFCDGDTKSEIVVPIVVGSECIGVLDVDSYNYNSFSNIDKIYLEKLIGQIKYKIQ